MAKRRILLCEDSRTYASALARTLEHDGSLSVVGVFPTAERALAELPRLKPDLVTMDLELPGMSGLDAVEQIMASTPTPIVVLSEYTGPESATAGAALAAGAVAAIPKREVDLRDPAGLGAAGFRRRLARLSGATVVRHPLARLSREQTARQEGRREVAAIGICASTGGPKALVRLLGALPASFPIPVIVVQHIDAGFEESFAATLARSIELPVAIPRAGEHLRRGVWLAAQGSHLRLSAGRRFELVPARPEDGHCPSGDVLLESLGRTFGPEAVGIILTGMGRDGARGIRELHAAGGLAIAQDEASAAVFGMPQAAIRNGAEVVLEPREIGRLLARLRPAIRRPRTGTGTPPLEGHGHLRAVR